MRQLKRIRYLLKCDCKTFERLFQKQRKGFTFARVLFINFCTQHGVILQSDRPSKYN